MNSIFDELPSSDFAQLNAMDPSPLPPAQRHSPTSVDAARQIEPMVGTLRGNLLSAIREAGSRGFTDEEGIDATGMSPSTYRPRRVELQQMGFVVDSGLTRLTKSGRKATVWVAVE